MSKTRTHWDNVYREKGLAQTSWFSPRLETSLRLIDAIDPGPATPVIDIGGGRSTLVDDLLARDFTDITVLDVAEPALSESRQRLGSSAARVTWLVADIADASLPHAHFGLWHDRAVFHFLVDAAARGRYVALASDAVAPGGYAIIATFAPDGPERCSGLPVARYDADALAECFAPAFERVSDGRELHRTPWDSEQAFTYVVLRRVAAGSDASSAPASGNVGGVVG
jgi:SAM-dependent methyltransferase